MNAVAGQRGASDGVCAATRWSIGLLLCAGLAAPVRAQEAPPWPDDHLSRLTAYALIQGLNADILASRTATASLQRWCAAHGLAADARITAQVQPGVQRAPSDEQRARLRVGRRERVGYRAVQLRCGTHVLSEAENWYVPGRLSAAMNRALANSDAPFGVVVQALQPYRRNFLVQSLWSPLPEGWERGAPATDVAPGPGPLAIPAALFEHRAVVWSERRNLPIAEVHEVYRGDLLAFPPPPAH